MLTGVIPFDGDGLMEVLYAHLHREPPAPSSRDGSLGAGVDAVIMRGLAKDPASRWDSAGAFVDALASVLVPSAAPAIQPTVALPPPIASTMPMAATALMERAEPVAAPSVLTLAYPSPPSPVVKQRSRKGFFALVAGIVIFALVLVTGVAWAATHRPVTFTLSATTVTAGDTVVVAADHLPANQVGRVELWSAQYTYPFRASGTGHMDLTITVPISIDPGDHQLKLCWNGACRFEQTLRVLSPAVASPSASPSPSPSPSASPRASPRVSPVASPSVSANPRRLTLTSYTIQVGIGKDAASGTHFAPGKVVTVTFIQGSTNTNDVLGSGRIGTTGDFTLPFQVPITATPGPALIVACDPVGCANAGVQVTVTGP